MYIYSRSKLRRSISYNCLFCIIEVSFGIYRCLWTIYIYLVELKAEAQYLIQMFLLIYWSQKSLLVYTGLFWLYIYIYSRAQGWGAVSDTNGSSARREKGARTNESHWAKCMKGREYSARRKCTKDTENLWRPQENMENSWKTRRKYTKDNEVQHLNAEGPQKMSETYERPAENERPAETKWKTVRCSI